MQKILARYKLPEFVEALIKRYEVIAPTLDKPSRFRKITSFKEINFNSPTDIPAKNIFMPEDEILLEFKNNKVSENKSEIKKTIVFGLRKCDLNAIQVIDQVMHDPQYINKRKNTILIGMFCDSPDKYCFCDSMALTDHYDLFFYPFNDYYFIDSASAKGKELVKNLPDAKKDIKIPNPANIKSLPDKDIERNYRNKIWETDAEKCLSCSACSVYCPTCNCFDIRDLADLDLKNGKRVRNQASCHLKSFSRVAGGKSYRDSRLSRFKHFVYHKIVYYKKNHNQYMCVGCGRCLRVCPAKIDWVNTINILKEMEKTKEVRK